MEDYVEKKDIISSWDLGEGKKVIVLEEESLVKLANPIELGTVPKGLLRNSRDTLLKKFVQAGVTDDLKG